MGDIIELNNILGDEGDVTNPECMDKILIYLEKLQLEDEEFMELLLEKIKDTTITWEQPWYQNTTCLTRPMKDINNENEENFRTDAICLEEDTLIQKNWRKFRRKYDLPDKLICFARWKNKNKSRNPNTPEERTRRFVTACLAQGLKRTIYQVYKHVTTYYGAPVRGPYSEIEEKIMEICFCHNPNKAVPYLSIVLARQPRGIYKKLQEMFNGKPQAKNKKWTLPLATKFLKLLIQHSGLSLEELKYKKFNRSVWLKLQEEFDLHYIFLKPFWYGRLHNQIFVKCDVKLNKLRKKVLKILKNSTYQVWGDIRWKEVVKHFPDGFTQLLLNRVTYRLIQSYPNRTHLTPLEDIVEFGFNRLSTYRNQRLKTLTFTEDGHLNVVKYDVKLKVKCDSIN